MRNNIYNINDLYRVIRRFYIAAFPYETNFSALEALNLEIKEINKDAEIVWRGPGLVFENPNPTTIKTDDPYDNENGSSQRIIEEYFESASSKDIEYIEDDLKHLANWLFNEGFINKRMPTEKMLDTFKLL
ncbi:hypothetical protein [Pantoea ananatis]